MSITNKNTSGQDQATTNGVSTNGSSAGNGRRQRPLERVVANGDDDLGFAGSTSPEGTTLNGESTAHQVNGHQSTATEDEDLYEAYSDRPIREGGLIDQWRRGSGGR